MTDIKIKKIINAVEKILSSQDYTEFEEMDGEEILQLVSGDRDSINGDAENMSRDYLYSSHSLMTDLKEIPALNKAEELMALSQPDDEGAYHYIAVGSLTSDTPWALFIDGFVGPYCDEDFDVNGNYSLMVGDSNAIIKKISDCSRMQIRDAFSVFSQQSKNALGVLSRVNPMGVDSYQESLLSDFMKTDIGKVMFPLLEKKMLQDGVPEAHQKAKVKKTL